ncbi:MAG: 4Fe-4S binding protein [Euryarchaeota archaeon]|nr:4Fe-4S binding protein [Euryarchaeota archaeon]
MTENNKERKTEKLYHVHRQKIRKALLFVSFLLLPVTINYLSPYLVIAGATEGMVTGSLIVLGLMFLFSLFIGRFWCGWLCPAGGIQELCFTFSTKNARGGRLNLMKYFFWSGLVCIVLFLVISAGGYTNFDFFYKSEGGISILNPLAIAMYYMMATVMILLSLIAGKRAFCHYFCWMAPFMIIGRKIGSLARLPSLRIKADQSTCISCKRCNRECPMSLDVHAMVQSGKMEDTECILCGTCIDSCPKGVITFGR